MSLEQTLIQQANSICPDVDPDEPIDNIADALTILVHESLPHDADIGTEEIYDYFKAKGL